MSQISEEQARKIAKLAAIDCPAESEKAVAKELTQILNWVEQLQTIDTRDIVPMSSPNVEALRFRRDEVKEGGYADTISGNAPEQIGSFFVVPKVVE